MEYVNALLEVMEQELRIYSAILKLSTGKTDIIVAGKMDELNETVKIEQTLLVQVGKLEQQRQEIVDKITENLNLDRDNINISTLLQYIDDRQKRKIQDYQRLITDVMNKLKDSNDLNNKLIKRALEYVDFSINVMTSSAVSGNRYEGKGTVMDSGGTRNLFDMKL